MRYTAKVEDDTIRLPSGAHLPNGTVVTIQPAAVPIAALETEETFAQRYAEFIGIWEDGPTDLAVEHDHYSSGAPRRNE